jgi:polysaccharide biosynthesis/export protein
MTFRTSFFNAIRSMLVAALPTIAAFSAFAASPVDNYHIAVGDVLSLWVEGAPELSMRLPVGMNGNVIVPLAGEARAAGLTLGEIRSAVASMLSQHMLYENSNEGRSVGVMIGRDQVVLDIAEYRPVYVTGDVAKSGAQAFRPGMTARQAISMAGGYDLLRSTGSNPLLDAFDLRSQQETLWITYAQTLANVRRVQAEIDDKSLPNIEAELSRLPIKPEVRAQIAETTGAQLKFRTEDFQRQKKALDYGAGLLRTGVSALSDELQKESDGVREDQKDLDAMQAFYKTNTISMARLLDSRRAVILSSSRSLQTMAQLNQMMRDTGDLEEKQRELEAQRRISLTQELQEGELKLASLRSQLDAAADKLLYASAIKSQFSTSLAKSRSASIYRVLDGTTTQVLIGDDGLLMPGDVIEVTFDASRITGEVGTQ